MCAILALVSVIPVMSAVKKTTVKKVPNTVVIGTKLLNGNHAKLGVTYVLGKRDPINVTLNKLEYSVEPIRFGNSIITPKSNEKLLVVHYTLQNCVSSARHISWSSMDIVAVDSDNVNWRYLQDVAIESTHAICRAYLKPAQKIMLYTAILVPAQGKIPRLVFQSLDKQVLRYDIQQKTAPLPDYVTGPRDFTKTSAQQLVLSKMGKYYPFGELHARIDSAVFSNGPFKNQTPKEGYRYLIVKGTAKNVLFKKHSFDWTTFKPALVGGKGIEIPWGEEVFYANKDQDIKTEINPNKELQFRWIFEIPDNQQVRSISVTEGSGRTFIFNLNQVK